MSYIDHQQSVLGAIFLEPSCLDIVQRIVSVDDFDETHGNIYTACLRVAENGGEPDLVTVSKYYHDKAYLSELVDFVPTTANVEYYAKQIAEFGQRKKVGRIIEEARIKLRDGENPFDWIEEQLSSGRKESEGVHHISSVLKDAWKEIEATANNECSLGRMTGVKDLDEKAIFQSGDFVVIAGRPAMGKSVIGAQILNFDKDPSLLFTYEMKNSQLVKRLIAAESDTHFNRIRLAKFQDNDYSKMMNATERLNKKQIYFCESSRLSIQDIRATSRVMKRKHGIKTIVLDYIQLCYDNTKDNKQQEIASISRNLKMMAQELDVCVVGLSQLNRSLESRDNKRPRMSDLRESGAIEQDADAVLFLYRDVVYNRNADERDAEIIIGKFRNGEIGYIPCRFYGEYQQFKGR